MHTNYYRKIFMLSFILLALSISIPVKANEATQEVVIIKYGLSKNATGFTKNETEDTGAKINNIPVDNTGNQLTPLAGIAYKIQEIASMSKMRIDINNPKSYQVMGSPTTLVTNAQGECQISLSDGYYIISEQKNLAKFLVHPAAPLLLALPQKESGVIYIYPKSSVDLPSRNSSSQIKNTTKEKGTLPKTGEVQDTLACIIGLGLFGLAFLLKKENKDKIRIIENS